MIFLPGLVVLALGLAVAVIVARLIGRRGAAEAQRRKDVELRIVDLEAQYRLLVESLRSGGVDGLSPADRRALEDSAAQTLLEKDAARRELERLGGAPATEAEGAVAAASAAPAGRGGGWIARHPLLAGFFLGGGIVALIGALVFWAIGDAKPREEGAMAGLTSAPVGGGQGTGTAGGRLAELETRLATNPADVSARKEQALLLLNVGQFFEAFESAQALLDRDADDLDGLYVQGVVRLTMGQTDQAIGLVDRLLEIYPAHSSAWMVRGLAYLQQRNLERAIESWERGLGVAGSRGAEFGRLLQLARSGRSPEDIFATISGRQASGDASGASPPSRPPDPFQVRIDLAPGEQVPERAVLFVFLRQPEPGPPAAVKRIDNPRFPIAIGLGPADSMLGRPLPESGTISARLDRDGSASTNDPNDLVGESPATAGTPVVLELARGD